MPLSVRARLALAQLIPLVPITALGVGAALSLRGLGNVVDVTRTDGLQRMAALAEAVEVFRQEAVLLARYREAGDAADVEAAAARAETLLGNLASSLEATAEGRPAFSVPHEETERLSVLILDYEQLAGLRGPPGDPQEADRAARRVLLELRNAQGRLRLRMQARLTAAADQARAVAVGIIAGGALLLAASVAATLLVSRTLVRDLAALEVGTSALSAGDYGHRIEVRGEDELARLATAFNRMAARIDALDRMKTDFLANISHDLKTPLTSILTAVELLDEEVPGPLTEDQRRLLRVMRESSARLRALVDNVLDSSRLGARNDELGAGDVGAAIDAVFSELRIQAERQEVRLLRTGLGSPPKALVNRGMLEQVLLNLVSNALKHSPRGGQIEVDVALAPATELTIPAPQALRISVSDQGPGIPEAWRERVFDRYVQVPSTSGPKGGTGLGLTICRNIVRSHGGRIGVATAPGGGATVWFLLAAPSQWPRPADAV